MQKPFWPLLPLLALAALPLQAQITQPNGEKAVYRYRTYTGTIPDYVSPLTGNISHAAGSPDIATTNRGTDYNSQIATIFDGSSKFERGAAAISTVNTASDEFTIEAWFQPTNVTNTGTLFSNTQSNTGFCLKLAAGLLQGTVRFKNGSSSVSVTLTQDAAVMPALTAGHWYYGVFHVRYEDSTHYGLRLYVNGTRVGIDTATLRYDGVDQSGEFPMVGAEPGAGVPTGDYFGGQIYAVAVSNWALPLTDYVTVKRAVDGGRYFGAPSYHDYLTTTASVAYRIYQTVLRYPNLSQQTDRLMLPFSNDLFDPEGFACDTAGSGYYYVACYWIDEDGNFGSGAPGAAPSIVAEIDPVSRAVRRVFQLRLNATTLSYGHLGGIAFRNGGFYAKYGTTVYRYNLADATNPTYIFNGATFANGNFDTSVLPVATIGGAPAQYALDLSSTLNTDLTCFDISSDGSGNTILWTTDFDPTATKQILGFLLDPTTGAVIAPPGKTTLSPLYALTLPVTKAQGVTCYASTSTTLDFYVNTSDGNAASVMYSVKYTKSTPTTSTHTTVFTGPNGMEDMKMIGSQVWTVSESGTAYYQKRATDPHTDLYPFIFGITP